MGKDARHFCHLAYAGLATQKQTRCLTNNALWNTLSEIFPLREAAFFARTRPWRRQMNLVRGGHGCGWARGFSCVRATVVAGLHDFHLRRTRLWRHQTNLMPGGHGCGSTRRFSCVRAMAVAGRNECREVLPRRCPAQKTLKRASNEGFIDPGGQFW